MAHRGRQDEEDDEGVVDDAVEVQLELEAVIDNGQVDGEEIVLVGHIVPWMSIQLAEFGIKYHLIFIA